LRTRKEGSRQISTGSSKRDASIANVSRSLPQSWYYPVLGFVAYA
jgi:hypothetical protein